MPADSSPVGVLLLQLGTPDSTEVADVRRYLAEFLADPRVLDIPTVWRRLLLHGVILRLRPRKSAEAYEKIWTEQGSPLLIHTQALADEVARRLGPDFRVAVGMRYRNPSIRSAVDRLLEQGVQRVVVLPLFPQYAASSGGSATEEALRELGGRWNVPDVTTLGAFHDDPGFLAAAAEVTGQALEGFRPDYVLFSYHGLPERQIRKSDPTGAHCLQFEGCCAAITEANRNCYRAQSFATTERLASQLGLTAGSYGTSFQSRLAGSPWIKPFTDQQLPVLYGQGVRRLAVACPSFVADCLETIEEIGIRARHQWMELGGEDFLLVPCVNSHPRWVEAVADMVRRTC